MMLKKTMFSFLLLFCVFAKPLAQDFLKFYVKEQRVKVDCEILEIETLEKKSLLDIETPNSFHALLSNMATKGLKLNVEDYTLVLTKYKDKTGKLRKVVARSKVTGKNAEGKKIEILAWTSNYYLEDAQYNNILIDQAFLMKGMGDEDEWDNGWVLLDANTGKIKAMNVNGSDQSEEDLQNSEQNKMIGEASYQGALLFKK